MKEFLEKNGFPSLSEVEAELGKFEEEEKDPRKAFQTKLFDKLDYYIKFIEGLLHPDSTIISMQEAAAFSEEDRTNLYALYKQLVSKEREHLRLGLSTSEEEKIAYLKEMYNLWLEKKEIFKPIIKQALSVWNTKDIKEKPNRYFG